MDHTICCGWLTKSPGSRYVSILGGKVQLPVKAKWRKRYFRLYKRDGEHISHKLSYYQDESLNKKIGSIKLEDCVKIQSSLDSSCYQHLFALQTCDTRNRVYYLAADCEDDMNTWVEHICELCKLKVDGTDPHRSGTDSVFGILPADKPIVREPERISQVSPNSLNNFEPAVTLGNAASGKGDSYREDYDVPPPRASVYPVESEAMSPDSVSDRRFSKKDSYAEDYDVPPTPNPVEIDSGEQVPRAGERASSEAEGPEEIYENATVFFPSNDISQNTANVAFLTTEETNGMSRPPRPPKPVVDSEEAEYGNLLSSGDVFAVSPVSPMTNENLDEIYDIPRSLCTAPPPMCPGGNTKIHKYINASTKSISIEGENSMYPDASSQPTKPPRETDASSPKHFSVDDQDVYDFPPTSRPLDQVQNPQGQASPSSYNTLADDVQVMSISQSSHTKSYVRDSSLIEDLSGNYNNSTNEPTDNQSDRSSSHNGDSDSDQIYDIPPTAAPLPQPTSPSHGLGRPMPAPRNIPIATPRSNCSIRQNHQ
ncbi:GRB2-associated-binding protein 1-like isoform X2 [Watersipora subatra]|uniref:GRB2-associated-binding protein 1-like isoform X2 n=1 Tax=Watersipora subatra TaxID=2589382 RepID=UPI00355BE24E